MPTRLRILLEQRRWHSYLTFSREYRRVAKEIDSGLSGSSPSRTQLHRWTSGEVKRTPYSDHCLVLEAMFPGWTVEQLLECIEDETATATAAASPPPRRELVDAVRRGLSAPDRPGATWGIPPRSSSTETVVATPAAGRNGSVGPEDELGRRILALQRTLRLSDDETRRLAGLAGHVVELAMNVDIRIAATGEAHLTFTHDVLNLTATPMRAIAREIWFRHTSLPKLGLLPVKLDHHQVVVHRVHDTPQMTKFSLRLRPSVEPGEVVRLGYTCSGGLFTDELYWRQTLPRHTRHLTLTIRQENATLLMCSAVEELPDGSEVFATDDVCWDQDGSDAIMTATRDHLSPHQALTLRWEIDRAAP